MVYSVQYLRAVAAIAVTIFHVAFIFGWNFVPLAAGVDLFFIISGFIMWTISDAKPTAPLQFIRNRIQRVLPIYWICTLLFVVAATVSPKNYDNAVFGAADIIRSLLFVPYADGTGVVQPVLVPGWTLNYEMFFYTAFCLVLFLKGRTERLLAITGFLMLCVAIGLFAPVTPYSIVYASPLLLEFLAGIVIAFVMSRADVTSTKLSVALMVLGLVSIAASSFLDKPNGFIRVLVWGVPSVLIVLGALVAERASLFPKLTWLKILGDSSYSLYLTHMIAIGVAKLAIYIAGVERWTAPLALRIPLLVVTTIFCVSVGLVFYFCVEKKIAQFLKRLERDRRAASYMPAE
ncbi:MULTISPECIES: acyltransferase family protein [Rhizobium]|uniref:Acyltransferase n=2 Tax=Rhizobium TaxID=379 RepID=A0A192TBH0_9HYPH|nr:MULTISPECIES: acyltransferase [Rhizobium]ACE91427.1 putative exopolysaccharide production acyltransferase protein [Rhizobium etli CIAT 652]ANL40851.1 acyltransferase 3 family protein [Rhizobium phaseoli]ANL53586.1 acyltransferase 3 family protein [Rhizobium phaseoli]ANL59839.1 acyltransferase 3 family protein [Rhizobium phaseoli]ANL85232.1 acyltransferase 3 family protein [Rhizobium phaseoli]